MGIHSRQIDKSIDLTMAHPISTALHHFASACLIVGVMSQSVLANSALRASTTPFEPEMFERGMCSETTAGITNTTIDQTGLTQPSLWWIRDQIAAQDKFGRRLIDGWLACNGATEPNRVDVVVNAQIWSSLDYFDRFEFIRRFGQVTSGYGYNLRVFNPQGELFAAYTCEFSANVGQKQIQETPIACTSFDVLAKTNFWSPIRPSLGF
ncbi:hypothetical protein IQ250_05920 [Pseudanabaenaceae cyanobacterium LEGE 13415]|nr:hypothetical protein [Pseudanabaenaceae cyanobacterium LEGE 13415]